MKKKVIEVNNLSREYEVKLKGKSQIVSALKGISFDVFEGEVFGLLGPNGAGKTTTTKILCTLLAPSSGTVRVLGHDVIKNDTQIRGSINFMFGGESGVYGRLTAEEYLRYFCCLYKIPKKDQEKTVTEVIKLVELEEKAKHKIRTFSKGMIQRLHIARSLINNPKIIFLDEPTIGLDPVIGEHIRKIIRNLSAKNITIILTTHYMKEADELCDRIGILNDGEFKTIGTPQEIKESCNSIRIYEATVENSTEKNIENSEVIKNVKMKIISEKYKHITFEVEMSHSKEEIKNELLQYFPDVITLDQKEISLEDAYKHIVKGA
ncbi:ABC transporter ATP-binding protein [Brevibacillus sp. SAFN-007a]|uniref:ABC transporter ATP-binding protein n=1 Tax=Brevibacillus sp. SAFN-007a TaxID=3436862 RepID=UPI003F803030